ncbi:MAG: hypothetical protein IPM53_15265 [Anaerolineaceae bacterium]|nr:hypothetical protein [Anaerolineaceae bacterium]
MERVLVVTAQTLFESAIVCWLLTTTELEIQTVSSQSEKNVLQAIRRFKPNVVVLDEGAYQHSLVRLLLGFLPCSDLRLVGVNSRNEFVHVYHVRQVQIEHISDFTTLVMGT